MEGTWQRGVEAANTGGLQGTQRIQEAVLASQHASLSVLSLIYLEWLVDEH